MRLHPRKQNPMKYLDHFAMDRDLTILQQVLQNKVQLEETRYWS
jgi:hypothetical protein